MKVTLGAQQRKFVYDVRFGERPVRRIMYGGLQIWPDETARVAKMSVDMSAFDGTLDGAYWLHAIDAVQAGSNGSCHMLMRAGGRDYMIQTTYDSWKRAVYSAGNIDFLGDGPMREKLRIGDRVTVKLVIPQRQTAYVKGGQDGYMGYVWDNYENENWLSCECLPTIPNTSVRGFFTKGQKKVSTGNRIIVIASTGQWLLDRHIQQDGHGRGYHDRAYGTVGFCSGSTKTTLRSVPHMARGAWGAYMNSPAFNRTVEMTVTGLTYY